MKFMRTFSVAKSCLKQAKVKIYLVSCLHIWKQKVSWENHIGICTDGTPSVVGSIRGFTSLVKKENLMLQHIALFTERYWFQKPLEMK
jgi:hypothetical protein